MGAYGDAGVYENVLYEIFSHGFENRYTTGWSVTTLEASARKAPPVAMAQRRQAREPIRRPESGDWSSPLARALARRFDSPRCVHAPLTSRVDEALRVLRVVAIKHHVELD